MHRHYLRQILETTGQEESASHHIWIIESESVWTSEERAELEELGIRTLRQPTPHELLVWTDQPQSLSGIVWTEWYGTSLDTVKIFTSIGLCLSHDFFQMMCNELLEKLVKLGCLVLRE